VSIQHQIAQQIFDDLIKRIQRRIRSEIIREFDPKTGLQSTYLFGKLLSRKQVRVHLLPPGWPLPK
jgi:hypothetical protein